MVVAADLEGLIVVVVVVAWRWYARTGRVVAARLEGTRTSRTGRAVAAAACRRMLSWMKRLAVAGALAQFRREDMMLPGFRCFPVSCARYVLGRVVVRGASFRCPASKRLYL